jgi:dolichol-phosphate mannosyltransferase
MATPHVAPPSDPATRSTSAAAPGPAAAPSSATATTSLTVIVPTRNEAANVAELVRRLDATLAPLAAAGHRCSIVYVDDSDDDTAAAVEAARPHSATDLYCVHRPPATRWGGLGGAVVDGLRATGAEWACVIDGDLQHPPELVAELFTRARRADDPVDLVVASRYCAAGSARGLDLRRTAISRTMTAVARWAFRGPLRSITDPMSGFFLVRRPALDLDRLAPDGFKILLEVAVRTPTLRVAEVPFEFGDRFAGDSKADVRVGVSYLRHVVKLRRSVRRRA